MRLGFVAAALSATLCVTANAADTAASRQLRFTIVVENPSGSVLHDQVVSLYVPAAETPSQTLAQVRASHPHRLRHDDMGNSILELLFDEVTPYATTVVTVDASVLMRRVPAATPLPDRTSLLSEALYIEIGDVQVRALALQLKQANDSQTAAEIYDWVRTNLEYAGFVADDLGAKRALEQRRGDCTEYAYLVAALARANGIPARVLGGYVTSGDAVPRSSEYHNWAELYVDGTWRLVDAQKERFFAGADEYVVMRIDGGGDPVMGRAHRFVVTGDLVVRVN